MKYPQNLLPQPIFKEITEDLSRYFVCRKVLGKFDYVNVGLPDEKLLGMESENECFDYSTNLPGVFELWHNKIELVGLNRKNFRSYWDWISMVRTPQFEDDFKLREDVSWFFLRIGAIEKITIPFNKAPNKNADDALVGVVVHTPTNCNFWHFSIKWKNLRGELISSNKATWKYNRIATLRALLSQLIFTGTVTQNVERDWYIKK